MYSVSSGNIAIIDNLVSKTRQHLTWMTSGIVQSALLILSSASCFCRLVRSKLLDIYIEKFVISSTTSKEDGSTQTETPLCVSQGVQTDMVKITGKGELETVKALRWGYVPNYRFSFVKKIRNIICDCYCSFFSK